MLEARRAEEEEARVAACTFSPDTTASKASAARMGLVLDGAEGGGEGGGAGAPQPHERLYRHAMERLERMRAQPSALELGCTFAPAISAVSRKITDTMREPAAADLPRYELLYEDGLQKQQARAAAAANRRVDDMTEEDRMNCTFQPAITPLPPKKLVAVPVHDRLFQHARDKQAAAVAAAVVGGPLPVTRSYASGVGGASVSPRSAGADTAALANSQGSGGLAASGTGSVAADSGAAPAPAGAGAPGDVAAAVAMMAEAAAPGESVEAVDGKEMFLI
jgi:hypothetical protein